MYGQVAATQTNYALTATEAAMKQPEQSALQRVLNEHGEQLERLYALANTLSDRLQPVRIDVGSPAAGLIGGETMNATQPIASPIVNQITLQTQIVKNLQRELDQLLQQLEI